MGASVLIVNLVNDFDGRAAGGAVDGLGYMGNARFLVGGEPVMAWNRSPYRLAYSLVIAPVAAVTDDPVAVFQRVVALNAVLLVVLFGVLYLIANRLLPDESGLVRTGVAAVGASYPSIVIYANTAFSETLLALIFAVWVLSLLRVSTQPDSRWAWFALGSVTYVAHFSHGRFIGLLPVAVCVAAWMYLRRGNRRSPWLCAGVVVAFALLRIPDAPNTS
ncbi:MAG: hypothetical protein P8N02_11500, partial [Actinomycetota bacterium]|nr:hypothetical protein [Actinomycetota bacterium]